MDKDRGGARWRQRRYFISRLKSRGICHLRARHLFPHPACDGGGRPPGHGQPISEESLAVCGRSSGDFFRPMYVTWKWTTAPKLTGEPSVANSRELRRRFPQSSGSVGLAAEVCSQRLFPLKQDCRKDPVTSSPRFLRDPAAGCSRT